MLCERARKTAGFPIGDSKRESRSRERALSPRRVNCRAVCLLARAPTAVYRLRKFVRRNRGFVAAVSCVIAALVAGLVASLILYANAVDSAEDARFSAERASEKEAEATRYAAEAKTEATRASEKEAEARKLYYTSDMQLVANTWRGEMGTARRVQELLNAHVPEPGADDLRDFAWFYHRNLLENTGRNC